MTLYREFTEDEQGLLRASLEAAGVVVSAASPGRREETVSEGFAGAAFVLEHREDYVGDPLVSSLILAIDERVRAGESFPDYAQVATAPGAEEEAFRVLRSAVDLVDRRATPDEAAGFKELLMGIASVVAAAGKEDQGFLGRGGVTVNASERAALRQIADILGLPPPAEPGTEPPAG